jgi:hypothetical protein
MKRTPLTGVAVAAAVASMSLATIVPASAQSMSRREQYVYQYCQTHPRDRDCYDFRSHRHSWNESRYRQWYRSHNNDLPPAVAGIFGLAAGAIIGGALANSNNNNRVVSSGHVARCEAHYRSYDVSTDTFLGYDGYRHYCNL